MKKNFKKLAILSMAAFLFLAAHQTFAMNPNNFTSSSESCLDSHALLIVSNYFSMADYANLTKTCKKYREIPELCHKNFVPLTKKELKFFPYIETYYVYGTRSDEYKPRSFTGNIKKIIYKAGSFSAKTIKALLEKNNNIKVDYHKDCNINWDDPNYNISLDIIFYGDGGKTKEFEVRLAELAVDKNGKFDINKWIKAYNKLVVLINKFMGGQLVAINRDDIQKFNIPEGVTEIGNQAFDGCENLTTINIPKGVTKIGMAAFRGYKNLTNINILEGVEEIGNFAFAGCTRLTDITIPEGVKRIGWGAFQGCTSLTDITIPEGVKRIGLGAFQGCTNLTNINILKGVTEIGWNVFFGCKNLKEITIPESVKEIYDCTFNYCTKLTNITYNGNTYHSVADFFAAFEENGGQIQNFANLLFKGKTLIN